MFSDMKEYLYAESVLNTLYIEIKHKCQKNKCYKKCPHLSFADYS